MIIQCAVVDDNLNDIRIIKDTLLSLCRGTDISIQIQSFHNPLNTEILMPFSLYILDIDMPELHGFELAGRIYEKYPDAVVIFCTMHDNLVYDSFRLNAFYFIRKNSLSEDLSYAVGKYVSSLQRKDSYIVRTSEGIAKVPVEKIIYFEVAHNDVYMHLNDNSEFRERKSLQKVAEELSSTGFVQIGKSFLVNLRHIVKISAYKAVLSNDQVISIPRSQYKTIYTKFLVYSSR